MTRQEALRVLGLEATATQEDVQREYRRLMKKLHPDLGGSSYLAAKLNEAKEVLR
jgi:DnaJ-class molecular chaperone